MDSVRRWDRQSVYGTSGFEGASQESFPGQRADWAVQVQDVAVLQIPCRRLKALSWKVTWRCAPTHGHLGGTFWQIQGHNPRCHEENATPASLCSHRFHETHRGPPVLDLQLVVIWGDSRWARPEINRVYHARGHGWERSQSVQRLVCL